MSSDKLGSSKCQTRRFRVNCLTNEGIRILDMDQTSCDEAIQQVRKGNRRTQSITGILAMSVARGIEVLTTDNKIITQYALTEIAFCFVSQDSPDLFAFIGKRGENILCNVFQCLNESEARMLYEGMSQLFNLASEIDKLENQLKKSRIHKYNGGMSFLGIGTKSEKPQKRRCGASWSEDSEEEELINH